MSETMKRYTKAAAVRAIKTVCQTAVATIGTATLLGDIDWKAVVSASVLAGILSILTSVGFGLPEAEMELEDIEDVEDEDEDHPNGTAAD